jgi:hypothetical protein
MGERVGVWAEINEDVSVPDLGMNAIQGIIFAAEAVVGVRGSDQAAIQAVGPTVVTALNPPREMSLGAGADAGATMPADIEERPQRVIFVTRNNDAFTGDLAQKVVSRLWNPVYTPSANPVVAVVAFEFVAEEIGVSVIAGG